MPKIETELLYKQTTYNFENQNWLHNLHWKLKSNYIGNWNQIVLETEIELHWKLKVNTLEVALEMGT